MMKITSICALATSLLLSPFTSTHVSAATCPYLQQTIPSLSFRTANVGDLTSGRVTSSPSLDFTLVQADIKAILTVSQSFWPADFGNYGPFLIRQAWHCAGSYRATDGLGGCDGGRQRFEPEQSWDDNTNLDKAKTLLWPIKQKYGNLLSWGDLIILAGNTALESMGAPVLGFCGGRTDDLDGTDSLLLGPTVEQQAQYPCAVNGNCTVPFGATTIGLIYVNPEGPFGVPDPVASSVQVRDTFSRMAMNDVETLALVGGGHTFGKTHGACSLGAGPSPAQDPANPWPGLCPNHTVFTSGFEGSWVFTPTKWTNSYWHNLVNFNWTKSLSPAGKTQWTDAVNAPGLMMLTADISLINDASFNTTAHAFASNFSYFADEFSKAWYKLTSRDMGPVSRCVGNLVPSAQPFQNPLPAAPTSQPDWTAVRASIVTVMTSSNSVLTADSSSYASLFVHLAWACAATFRSTDYLGGCNGARIRFAPQLNWAVNANLDQVLAILKPVKTLYDANLTWSDLIVYAAQVALETATGTSYTFCPGRSDATDGTGSALLSPQLSYTATLAEVEHAAFLLGLTNREVVALAGRLRSPGQLGRLGYMNQTYTSTPNVLDNSFFVQLVNNKWQNITTASGQTVYQATNNSALYMTSSDLALRWNPAYLTVVQQYASNNTLFLIEFAQAWTNLMNADRFSGPTGNVCDNLAASTTATTTTPTTATPTTATATTAAASTTTTATTAAASATTAASTTVTATTASVVCPTTSTNVITNAASSTSAGFLAPLLAVLASLLFVFRH